MKPEEIVDSVKESYGKFAREGGSRQETAKIAGYTDEQIQEAPEAADMSRGCGNPVALATMNEGEIVLDLGSGAGFDAFLAANRVGAGGKVIGVDMTEDMVARARENAKNNGAQNVELRLGRIEDLPVDDASVDAIISNCVINLSVDKKKVFQEAFRVLKPGGRLMVSDMALLRALPEAVRDSVDAYMSCVGGALEKDSYLNAIREAGFQSVEVVGESTFSYDLLKDDPFATELAAKAGLTDDDLKAAFDAVASIKVSAVKS